MLALAAAGLPLYCAQPLPADSHRQPVLVELFTSEGCSDCPPADALLARLDSTQFVPGAHAIVLSEHVTYWDHQGWRDPFSLDEVTQRQQAYQTQFALNEIYTPQVVVDGANQVLGNNVSVVSRAVADAARTPKMQMSIADAQWDGRGVRFTVRDTSRPKTHLIAVLAVDSTTTDVTRGENAGRTLHNVAVVRVIKDFGAKIGDGQTLRLPGRTLDKGSATTGLVRLVVFLVDEKSHHVDAVAEQIVKR